MLLKLQQKIDFDSLARNVKNRTLAISENCHENQETPPYTWQQSTF